MVYGSVYGLRESVIDTVEPYAFDESLSFAEMGAQMIEEATADWNTYMQAIALTELSYVMETGQEYIYESVDIKAMASKVKEWFMKLLAKIKGIAKSALAKFNSFAMNDQKFIDKYEKQIYDGANKLPSGFSYKGYAFDNLAGKANVIGKDTWSGQVGTKFLRDVEKVKSYAADEKNKDYFNTKNTEKLLNAYRGKLTGKQDVTSSEFGKAIKEDLYGSADKVYIRTVNAGDLISIVKGAKDAIQSTKDAEGAISDDIDSMIEAIDNMADEIAGTETEASDTEGRKNISAQVTYFNNASKYLQSIQTINATWFSKYISALKDQNRQAKAVCTKLISYANGVGGAKNESYAATGSLLEDRFAALDF